MTPTTDLTKIERSVFIRAPRTRVWRAITDVAEFSAWFQVKAQGQFAPHSKLRMVSTHPKCLGLEFDVTVEDVTPEQSFAWRWHPGAEAPDGGGGGADDAGGIPAHRRGERHARNGDRIRLRPHLARPPREGFRRK